VRPVVSRRILLSMLALVLFLPTFACNSPAPSPLATTPEPTPVPLKANDDADPLAEFGRTEIPGGLPRSLPERIQTAEKRFRVLVNHAEQIAGSGRTYSSFHPQIVEAMRLLDAKPGEVVADVGCGTGQLTLALLESGAPPKKIYAVDNHKPSLFLLRRSIEIAKLRGDVVTVPAMADNLNLPAATIDRALVINVAFYLDMELPGGGPNPAVRARSLASLWKAMKKGGRLVVLQPNTPIAPTTDEQIAKHFLIAGFQLDRIRSIDLVSLPYHLAELTRP
jgi:SAM-dependent methyltransferase